MLIKGILRLARVLVASKKIQNLVLRDMEEITQNHFGIALNKNTLRAYQWGRVKRPQEYALQKLTPLLLKVKGFTNDDDIGYPEFEEIGTIPFKKTKDNPIVGNPLIKSSQIIDDDTKEQLLRSTKLDETPLSHLRYRDWKDVKRIIEDDTALTPEAEKKQPVVDPINELRKLYPQLIGVQ